MTQHSILPTHALNRKWKMERDKAYRNGDRIKYRKYERKLLESQLQEIEMDDGRITFMEVQE